MRLFRRVVVNPRRITEEECLWALDDAYLEYVGVQRGMNTTATTRCDSEVARAVGLPHHRTIRRRLGSWAAAGEAVERYQVELGAAKAERLPDESLMVAAAGVGAIAMRRSKPPGCGSRSAYQAPPPCRNREHLSPQFEHWARQIDIPLKSSADRRPLSTFLGLLMRF